MSVLNKLAEDPDVAGEHKARLKMVCEQLTSGPKEHVQEIFTIFKAKNTRQGDLVRLHFALHPLPIVSLRAFEGEGAVQAAQLRKLLVDAMTQAGGERRMGAPPPGDMERQLGSNVRKGGRKQKKS